MRLKKFFVVLVIIIALAAGIYYFFINYNIKKWLNSENILIPHIGNKVSNSEVNNINQKSISMDKNIATNLVVSDKTSLTKLILKNIILGKDTIVTIKDNSIRSSINDLANNVAREYGYSGYISDLSYSVQGNKVYLHFDYKNGYNYFSNCINAVNSKINTIISQIIKQGMSDFNKELAIHNYIVNNVTYDSKNLESNTLVVDDFTAYGALINGVCVCEGYSEAVYRLLNAANINNFIVFGTGNNISHSWNIVKINGTYYHLDATFDDPISNNGPMLSYGYFNLSDFEIALTHAWNKSLYPKCDSTLENYYIVNHLVANNARDLYNIIKNGLSRRQTDIRCKTSQYDNNIFNPSQIISDVINDNSIGYINTKKGFTYDYNKNTCEMQIFMTYKQ